MEEIYVNVNSLMKSVQPAPEERSPDTRSSEGSLSSYVPLYLGLLILALLTGLVVVSVFFYLSAAELIAVRANLTQLLLACADEPLRTSGERDPPPTVLAVGTEASKKLREEETCPSNWMVFRGFCYLFSSERRSWEASRQSCRQAGADLVVIDTPEEQNFLAENITEHMWIGLTDVETEGKWKWIDGNPLTDGYWIPGQPDNWIPNPNLGDEDCAHLKYTTEKSTQGKWNDINCNSSLCWVCKKKLA